MRRRAPPGSRSPELSCLISAPADHDVAALLGRLAQGVCLSLVHRAYVDVVVESIDQCGAVANDVGRLTADGSQHALEALAAGQDAGQAWCVGADRLADMIANQTYGPLARLNRDDLAGVAAAFADLVEDQPPKVRSGIDIGRQYSMTGWLSSGCRRRAAPPAGRPGVGWFARAPRCQLGA